MKKNHIDSSKLYYRELFGCFNAKAKHVSDNNLKKKDKDVHLQGKCNQGTLHKESIDDNKFKDPKLWCNDKMFEEFDQDAIKKDSSILPENRIFLERLGKTVLIIMSSNQLNILGQTFRPLFCGRVVKVTNGFVTLDPVNIKMHNAPFFVFPTPLNFPIENISVFLDFDCSQRISIT